jgi:hypothetical protein
VPLRRTTLLTNPGADFGSFVKDDDDDDDDYDEPQTFVAGIRKVARIRTRAPHGPGECDANSSSIVIRAMRSPGTDGDGHRPSGGVDLTPDYVRPAMRGHSRRS